MTQENVDLALGIVDAFNRRDRAAWMALCDPELENVPPANWPDAEVIRGREAVWDFWVQGNEMWKASSFETSDLAAFGEAALIAQVRGELQGKASGVNVVWSYWVAVTFHDRKLARTEWFDTRAEAIDAVGQLD